MNVEESQLEKSLRRMYELGVEHGRLLAEREFTIRQLEERIANLELKEKVEDK